MKICPLILMVSGALCLRAAATTVIVDGLATGRPFGSLVQPGFAFTPTTATIQVGTLQSGIFTQFAGSDQSQPTFFDVPSNDPFAGIWTGDATDITPAASAFNGQQIWFRVTWNQNSFSAYLTSGALFPVNGLGTGGDSIQIDSRDLTIPNVIPNNTLFSYVDVPNDRIVIFAPEPSAALLGLISGVGLLRRRRG